MVNDRSGGNDRRDRAKTRTAGAIQQPTRGVAEGYFNGQAGSCRALRGGDGSRYSRCRFRILQKPILGTADSEYRYCLGVRGFLLEIFQAFMTASGEFFSDSCSTFERPVRAFC
jgi:hypothetical protein